MSNKKNQSKTALQRETDQLRSKISGQEKSKLQNSGRLEDSSVYTKIVDLDFNLQCTSNDEVREPKIDDITDLKEAQKLATESKELAGIYKLSNVLMERDLTKSLPKTVAIIPSLYQFPELICVRIVYGDSEYKTRNFKKTKWHQYVQFATDHYLKGTIEICYLEDKQFTPDEENIFKEITHKIIQITEKKKADEELRKSEKKYQDLINVTQEGIWFIDKNNLTNFADLSMAKMLKYTPEEMIGKSLFDFMDKASVKVANENLERQKAGFKEPHNFEFICKDNTRIYCIMKTAPIVDDSGNYQGTIAGVIDITQQKRTEEALRQSEDTIKNKLKVITQPEGGIETLELSDIIDTEVLQSMMEDFYQLTGILGAVLDVKGNVLVAVGWQDICTKFHRCNPHTLKNCIESDTILTSGVPAGTFKAYRCKNNMWDIVTPLIVGGKHVGNVFIGQFLDENEMPDVELFRKLAKQYGFDENEYLAALERVPRFSKETVNNGMQFYSKLAGIISTLSYSTIQQSRMLTERKQAEEKIRAAEENLKSTFDLSPSIISKANLKTGYFTKVNQAVTRILGYSIEEFTSNPLIEFIHPDDRQRTIDEISEELKGKEVTFFENRYLCKDGSYKWIAWHGTKADENGIVTAIGSDINERKLIEQEIVKTKQFYESIIEGVQDGIWVSDENDIVYYANLAMEKIVGVPRKLIQGKNIFNDFPEETTGELIKLYQQAKQEKKPVWFDLKINTHTRVDTWQNGWLIPQYHNHTFTGLICTTRDVTERRKAEGNVRKLSTAVKQSPSIIVIADTKGKLEYVNPKFAELTGYSSEEAIGQESNLLKSGEQDAAFYKEMWGTVESGKEWRGQFHNKKKNGELFWEAASISAIFNEQGEIINYIKIGEDITQQKNNEIKLNQALEKALESDRLKSAFLANMSHEIRTPMNGILGFTSLLKEPGLSGEEQEQYINIIEKSGDRMLGTIQDIIDISKIESGQVNVNITEINLNQQMDELFDFFVPEANAKQIQLSIANKLTEQQAVIKSDEYILNSVVTNLIKNAIKYTHTGTIKFGYTFNEKGSNPEWIFQISDTGIGIRKENQHAIFERFMQAKITDKRIYEGTGLGLAISKAYIEILGGKIWVESEVGVGSEFYFTVPFQQ